MTYGARTNHGGGAGGRALAAGSLVAVLLGATAPAARGGTIQPGNIPFSVTCDTTIDVDDTNNGATLTLDATDPIVTQPCPGDGIRIRNGGKLGIDRSYTLDCNFFTIQGQGQGRGVQMRGSNLTLFNCIIDGFKNGIYVRGDGGDIEECRATSSTGDGIVVKNPIVPRNPNFFGIFFDSNRAIGNAGWGMNLRGAGIELGMGTFSNVAQSNGKGGIQVRGGLAELSGNEASSNGGPGFFIRCTQCCAPNTFDTAQAFSNAGPGIVYIGRDDATNCVGGTGADCTGGTFYPSGFDTTPGGIDAFGNGECPPDSIPNSLGSGVCPIVQGQPCSDKLLLRCPF